MDSKLIGDISVHCNYHTDCPIGLICEKYACKKQNLIVLGKYKYPIDNFLILSTSLSDTLETSWDKKVFSE